METEQKETDPFDIENLPLVDLGVMEIISLLDAPDSNFDQIIKKLSPDVASEFLKMANSAYYSRDVQTVDFAVRVLGYSKMKQILTASLVMDHFSKSAQFKNFDFKSFQKQAHCCAVIAEILGQIMKYPDEGDLFTVAMLQNIGKLIVATHFPDEHKKIKALRTSEKIPTREAEQRILGRNHAEIGALVLNKFKISKKICDAVRLHEAKKEVLPEDADFRLIFILKATSRIVDHFALPNKMEPPELAQRLKPAIREGLMQNQKMLTPELRAKGPKAIFMTLLKSASEMLAKQYSEFAGQRVYEDFEIVLDDSE
jgi:HD-like signal output (HDOD) protein